MLDMELSASEKAFNGTSCTPIFTSTPMGSWIHTKCHTIGFKLVQIEFRCKFNHFLALDKLQEDLCGLALRDLVEPLI